MSNIQNIKAKNRLKVVLAEKGMTAKSFANGIGKSENTISRWCLNKVQPSLLQPQSIANYLDIDIHDLIQNVRNESCEK